jgi:hypothetical protein
MSVTEGGKQKNKAGRKRINTKSKRKNFKKTKPD